MVNLLKNQQFNKLHFLVGKWTELCEKLQKGKVKVLESSLKLGSGGLQSRKFYALMPHGITYRDASHVSASART